MSASVMAETLTGAQIRELYDRYLPFDEHIAYACARALLPETHRAFSPQLRDEARTRCAKIWNALLEAEVNDAG